MDKKQLKQFAIDTKVGIKLAKRILDRLELKGLKAEELSSVMRRLKDFFTETKYGEFLKSVPDSTLDAVIDKMTLSRMGITTDAMEANDKRTRDAAHKFSSWIFSKLKHKTYKAGDTIDIQIMRVGERDHYEYGKVKITEKRLDNIMQNFNANVFGQEIPVDENHEDEKKALGRYKKIYKAGKDALFATIELTRKGAQLLTDGAYRYFSPEFFDKREDEETGKVYSDLLTGGAFTNNPYFKGMQPIVATDTGATAQKDKSEKEFFIYNQPNHMNRLQQLLKQFNDSRKVTKEEQQEVAQLFSNLQESEKTTGLIAQVGELMEFTDKDPGTDGDGAGDASGAGGEDAGDASGADDDADDEEDDEDEEDDSDDEDDEDDDEEDAPGEDDAGSDAPKTASDKKPTEAKKMSVDAAEYTKMKSMSQKYTQLKLQERNRKVNEKVASLTFSDKSKTGSILPKLKDEFVQFAEGLSRVKRKQFFALIEKNKFSTQIFTALGSDEGGAVPKDEHEAADQKAQQYMDEHNAKNPNNKIDYNQALRMTAKSK